MINVPRLVRTGQDLTLTWPMAPWTPGDRPIGGGERSAAGIPSNYVLRTEPLLRLVLRIDESEWADVVAFLRGVDAAGSSWTLYPDASDALTSYTVYLESPSVANGEEITPARDENDLSLFTLPVTVRRTSETVFDVPLYG